MGMDSRPPPSCWSRTISSLASFLADNLTADGYALVAGRLPSAAAERLIEHELSRPRALDLGLPDGDGLELVAAHARRRSPARPDRSRPARARPVRAHRGARSPARLRARVRRLRRQAVQLPGAAGARRRPAAAHSGGPPRPHGCASGRSRSIRWRASVRCAASRWPCPRRSSRCCVRWPRIPTRVSRARSCCGPCGAFRPPCPTRTLDSHAFRLRRKLGCCGDRFVINVWGVGYRLIDGGEG